MKDSGLKFFLYARKSQESDERQVQSINDQLDAMKEKAKKLGYNIIGIYTESKTAKEPGRLQFNEMIKAISRGEANGIISWKLDRLTRNPIDTGTIQYMLQNGLLQLIHTTDSDYNINNSGLMFSVIAGMANQFIIDLSKNVKRGLNSKANKGWFPGVAPEGYKNNLEDNTIIPESTNFTLVQKMWQLMLTGNYSVTQIVDIANNEWGFKTTKRRKIGGKALTYSSGYRIFNNIFYTGYFNFNGNTYDGKHKKMITLEEYYKVQKLIGDKGKAKVINHEFPYGGMFNCGCCNYRITAENKLKKYKSGNSKLYTYYRCTKKNREVKCDNLAIQEAELESQLYSLIKNLHLNNNFYDWAINIIERESINEQETLKTQKLNLQKQLSTIDKKLDNLSDLYLEGGINIDEFNKKKNILNKNKILFTDSLKNLKGKMGYKIEEIKKIINFGCKVDNSFKNGNIKTKKVIVKTIGSDHTLYLKKMAINLHPWFLNIKDFNENKTEKNITFGPLKNGINIKDTNTNLSNIPIWQGP